MWGRAKASQHRGVMAPWGAESDAPCVSLHQWCRRCAVQIRRKNAGLLRSCCNRQKREGLIAWAWERRGGHALDACWLVVKSCWDLEVVKGVASNLAYSRSQTEIVEGEEEREIRTWESLLGVARLEGGLGPCGSLPSSPRLKAPVHRSNYCPAWPPEAHKARRQPRSLFSRYISPNHEAPVSPQCTTKPLGIWRLHCEKSLDKLTFGIEHS